MDDSESAGLPPLCRPDHGRLIDADKLRESVFIGEQCIYSWDEIDNAIDYATTIIPADKEGDNG